MVPNFLMKNIDISNLSNFKTKAFAKYFYEINSIDDIKNLSIIKSFSSINNLPIVFIWWWTNILFAFDEYNWIIVKNNLLWYDFDSSTSILNSFSSELISDLSETLEKSFWNNIWHRFIWLPWTVWWAIFWNAWCFWLDISCNFISAMVFDLSNWDIFEIKNSDKIFSYRNSYFKDNPNLFIISAKFNLWKLVENYSSNVDNIEFRNNIQPKWNSCWSFFKNPSKDMPAWKLLEDVWLKWYVYWDAYFSDKHSNFLMTSIDYWNYNDLLFLIDKAKTLVSKKHSIDLIEEVKILYNID